MPSTTILHLTSPLLPKQNPQNITSHSETAMEMEKLLKFKFHILIAAAFSLIILSLLYVAPSFINILAYFWPLLLSTALFLVAVVVFDLTSPPSAQVSGEKAGEGILDYVAGRPEPVVQPEFDVGEGSSKSDQM